MTDKEIHELEKKALAGDQSAIVKLVSGFRKLRAKHKKMMRENGEDTGKVVWPVW